MNELESKAVELFKKPEFLRKLADYVDSVPADLRRDWSLDLFGLSGHG